MSEAKRAAEARMVAELRRLQEDLAEHWVERSLPDGWHMLEKTAPVAPAKAKVTLRLDADMLRWFKKLGPGYGVRINAVLRVYWEALVAGRIKAHWDEGEVAPTFLEMVDKLAAMQGGE